MSPGGRGVAKYSDLLVVVTAVSREKAIKFYDGAEHKAHRMLAGKYIMMLQDLRFLHEHKTRFIGQALGLSHTVRDAVSELLHMIGHACGTVPAFGMSHAAALMSVVDHDEWPCFPNIDELVADQPVAPENDVPTPSKRQKLEVPTPAKSQAIF